MLFDHEMDIEIPYTFFSYFFSRDVSPVKLSAFHYAKNSEHFGRGG